MKDTNSLNRDKKLSPHDIDSSTNFNNDSIICRRTKPLLIDKIGLSPDYEFCNGRTKGEIFDKINELIEEINAIKKQTNPL